MSASGAGRWWCLLGRGGQAAENSLALGHPGQPETFGFLGFTHLCAETKTGRFWVRRITIAKRMRVKAHEFKEQIKRRRHVPIPEQGRWLKSVAQGHLAYYAVPGNTDAVAT
jgi:hypothetical protein